jgi:hypothetical protein
MGALSISKNISASEVKMTPLAAASKSSALSRLTDGEKMIISSSISPYADLPISNLSILAPQGIADQLMSVSDRILTLQFLSGRYSSRAVLDNPRPKKLNLHPFSIIEISIKYKSPFIIIYFLLSVKSLWWKNKKPMPSVYESISFKLNY